MAVRRTRADGVVQSDISVRIFVNIVSKAYDELFTFAQSKDFKDGRSRELLKKIDSMVAEADANVQAWVKTQVPAFYEKGMFQTLSENAKQEATQTIRTGFASFHREAVVALVNDTYQNMAVGMQGLSSTGYKLVTDKAKQSIVEELGSGRITGKSIKDIQEGIVSQLKKDGIRALTDRGGKTWNLDSYGEMLARTKLTQAHNIGVSNTMAEQGYDLVMVSQHWGACELCTPHEGRIYSVRGATKGYPTVAEAEADGLFHPNCKHTMTPYHADFLEGSQIWDSQLGKYVPFEERRVWDKKSKDFVPFNKL